MKNFILTSFLLHLFLFINAQQIDVYQRPVQHERSREFDAIHYRITLDVDMENKMLSGSNTITLKPLNDGLETISLDAVSLVMAEALKSLGKCGGKSELSYLKEAGKVKSHRNIVGRAASQAMDMISSNKQ